MNELLELCGIEGEELQSQLPRIKRAFDKLGITDKDIEESKKRVSKYYDIDLKGVRKALRLCLLEVVNAVLAREEKDKVFYGYMSAQFGWIAAPSLRAKSDSVYAAPLDMVFPLVTGGIFEKQTYFVEESEKLWLKAGKTAHCANLKTILGLIATGALPHPDLMVVSDFNCETAPKTLELMHEIYDIPVHHFGTCVDIEAGEKEDERTIKYSEKSLRELFDRIQGIAGIEITRDVMMDAIKYKMEMFKAINKLNGIIRRSDPLVIKPTNDIIWTVLYELPLYGEYTREALDAVNTTCEELSERVEKGEGAVEKGAPRLYAALPPHQSDPRLEYLITELGIALLPTDGPPPLSVPTPSAGRPVVNDIDENADPFTIMTEGSEPPLREKMPGMIEGWKKLDIDGFLDRYHAGCRATVGEAMVIKEAVEKELGIPALLLEWEGFDPRAYKHDEYKRKLEVLKSMMIEKRAEKQK